MVDDAEGVTQLGEVLRRTEYTTDGFRRALGAAHARPGPVHLPVYLRRMPPDEPLTTLLKLFFLGTHVPVEDAAAALAPLELGRLERMNVLRGSAFGVEATLEIGPVDGLLIASDPDEIAGGRPDHTTGISGAALTLASVTIRRPVERALDIGTGSGTQALLLALHAGAVVGTDINRRALAYAAFNALLNGIENLTLREGSLFEPVAGETFDLVVSNPPYVISPDTDFLFRDSDLPGDSISGTVVGTAPRHLREGGFAEVLVNWIVPEGEHWSNPLRRWVEGSGCDALLLRNSNWDGLDYASDWNTTLRGDPDAFSAALDRWLDHFRRLNISALAGGLVVLRKRSGTNWVLELDPSTARVEPSGDQILRLFEAQDFVRSRTDAALLGERFTCSPDLVVDIRLRPRRRARLGLERGLALRADVDERTVRLLDALDGDATLEEALVAAEADQKEALAAVRRLIELGFVVPR